MTQLTHDAAGTPEPGRGGTSPAPAVGRLGAGFAFAIASAASFGLSGALARGLMDAGWTAGSAVAVRVLGAFVVLAVPAYLGMRGRWHLLRRNVGLVLGYGVLAVAATQLFYFNAVNHLSVGVALLIEYTAPVAVIGWLWLRHGQRPGRLTVLGALVAAAGLVLVLDVVSGASVSTVGVLWALGAMVGAAAYFILSATDAEPGDQLPPLALAAAGMLVGGLVLVVAGLVGIVPFTTSTASVSYRGMVWPWWLPLVLLAVVTAAMAYTTGIAAIRRLGSRLASFTALTEVLFALVFAWLLLAQLPGLVQLLGGVLIVGGVGIVKAGERVTVEHGDASGPQTPDGRGADPV